MSTLPTLPFSLNGVMPESGRKPVPPGWYLLRIKPDGVEIRTGTQDTTKQRLNITCEILQGPGPSMEYAGKQPLWDGIPVEDKWKGRIMELLVACLGSMENVNQALAQQGGVPNMAICNGRTYIAEVVINGNYNNVNTRLPATQENWNKVCGLQAGAPAAAPAPAPAVAAPAMPAMPAMAPAPAFAAAPAYAAPIVPTFAPTAPAFGFPAPPPPPGTPGR